MINEKMPKTLQSFESIFSSPSCHDDGPARSGQRGPPPRPTRHVAAAGQLQRREREDRSGSARPGGLGPQCLPDTRTRRRRPPYRPLPRCLAIVLCTDRRGAAVLCDQVSIIHACMHPGHVRSPNTIVRLIRHRRQQACYYALPAPCTQHTRRDSGFITACWRALQLASDSQPVHIRTPMASIEHVAKQILPLLTSLHTRLLRGTKRLPKTIHTFTSIHH